MNCSKLEEITFPNSLVSIETNAFMSCIALKQINLPTSLKFIRHRAFHNRRQLLRQ